MTNGVGKRKCPSWIEQFVEYHVKLESPEIYRRWAAIATISAVLEQKVWLTTTSPIPPNLYTILVGNPGVGKTRAIRQAIAYLRELPDAHIAPTSLTFASLVDSLVKNKRTIIRIPEGPLEYNSMLIAADELGTFIHKYDKEMSDGLSAFYDPIEYGHERRGNDIKIKIKSPQLNIFCGCTPSGLLETTPEGAWGQGFMSRVVLIYSDEKIIGDDFVGGKKTLLSPGLVYDLAMINTLIGEFGVTEDYRNLVNEWRHSGEKPLPTHPKLLHYNARRKVHLYKLSMVSAIDRSNVLLLTAEDFHTAKRWLTEAETIMPEIFRAGSVGADAMVIDEAYHYVMMMDKQDGTGVYEPKLVKFVSQKVPAHTVKRLIEIMVQGGMLRVIGPDKLGLHSFTAIPRS